MDNLDLGTILLVDKLHLSTKVLEVGENSRAERDVHRYERAYV